MRWSEPELPDWGFGIGHAQERPHIAAKDGQLHPLHFPAQRGDGEVVPMLGQGPTAQPEKQEDRHRHGRTLQRGMNECSDNDDIVPPPRSPLHLSCTLASESCATNCVSDI